MALPALLPLLLNRNLWIFVAILSALVYVHLLRQSVLRLEKQNRDLLVVVEQQHRTITQMKLDVERVIKARDDLAKTKELLESERRSLTDTLYRENRKKKSLEELARKRTTLIQTKVNRATDEVFKCFEELSRGGEC